MAAYPVIDAHFHIWDLKRFDYPWPSPDIKQLYKDFCFNEYIEERPPSAQGFAIFIQVLNNCPEEAKWALSIADKEPIIKGVVAGLDLTSEQLPVQLDELAKDVRFVGVRHILDFEEETWLTREDVHRGLGLLEKAGKTFDLLLRPHLLKYVPDVVSKFPRLRFVIDHIAKPYIKNQVIDGWKEDMATIAKFPNVYCKISGLIPEADHKNWKPDDFKMYIKHILAIFGEDRCMFASDWPVFHVSQTADYEAVFNLTKELVNSCGVDEEGHRKIFSQNAVDVYQLKI